MVTTDDLPEVLADRSQLVMVFQNLINNAVKFSKPDETPLIHVGAEKKDREMEPFIVTLMPSGAKEELSAHTGQEFIYVMEGELEVILNDQKDILYPGDSIYYDSKVPHLVHCHGEKETIILAVLYTKDT